MRLYVHVSVHLDVLILIAKSKVGLVQLALLWVERKIGTSKPTLMTTHTINKTRYMVKISF